MAWLKVNDMNTGLEGIQSPVAKFLNEEVLKALVKRLNLQKDDIVFFGADNWHVATNAIGALRLKVGTI